MAQSRDLESVWPEPRKNSVGDGGAGINPNLGMLAEGLQEVLWVL